MTRIYRKVEMKPYTLCTWKLYLSVLKELGGPNARMFSTRWRTRCTFSLFPTSGIWHKTLLTNFTQVSWWISASSGNTVMQYAMRKTCVDLHLVTMNNTTKHFTRQKQVPGTKETSIPGLCMTGMGPKWRQPFAWKPWSPGQQMTCSVRRYYQSP